MEYTLDDTGRPAAAGTTYRLITTVLDPAAAPADELAGLYAQRWEIESIFDELKTHQRGPRVILRSRTPDGVKQEAWGYLCVHYALRALIQLAADDHDLDPEQPVQQLAGGAAQGQREGDGAGQCGPDAAAGGVQRLGEADPPAGYGPTPASCAER